MSLGEFRKERKICLGPNIRVKISAWDCSQWFHCTPQLFIFLEDFEEGFRGKRLDWLSGCLPARCGTKVVRCFISHINVADTWDAFVMAFLSPPLMATKVLANSAFGNLSHNYWEASLCRQICGLHQIVYRNCHLLLT